VACWLEWISLNDLFADQVDQETKWKLEIERTQIEFETRFWKAFHVGRNKANRKKHYTQLRKEMGDDAAREVAKLVEGIYAGNVRYPRWFRRTG